MRGPLQGRLREATGQGQGANVPALNLGRAGGGGGRELMAGIAAEPMSPALVAANLLSTNGQFAPHPNFSIHSPSRAFHPQDEVAAMVSLATSALERDIIHAERTFFFLVDGPRGELWLHSDKVGALEAGGLGVGEKTGCLGQGRLYGRAVRSSLWTGREGSCGCTRTRWGRW